MTHKGHQYVITIKKITDLDVKVKISLSQAIKH